MISRPVTNDQRERQLLKAETLELTALLAAQHGRVSFPESVGGLIPFLAAWLISAASRLLEKT